MCNASGRGPGTTRSAASGRCGCAARVPAWRLSAPLYRARTCNNGVPAVHPASPPAVFQLCESVARLVLKLLTQRSSWPFDVAPSAQGPAPGLLGYQAMLVGDRATASTRVNALSQARQFGLKPDGARAVIKEVSTGAAGWTEAFTAKGVIARDIALLAQYIDRENLRHQRGEFATRHAGSV